MVAEEVFGMRKDIKGIEIVEEERKAILEFKRAVNKLSPGSEFILFGSRARGENNKISDIDILVLVNHNIESKLEEKIFEQAFEVGLNYEVTFGIIVYSKEIWNSSLAREMPLHWNIDREGILI